MRPRTPGEPSGPWSGHAEVEELPAQAVMPRGTPRLGLTGTIAVIAMVGLLAAGFGMLGGRPDASPDGQAASTPSSPARSASPAPTPPRVVHPKVTPWTECGRPRALPPSIDLQVDGTRYAGTIEEMDLAFFGIPSGPMRGLPEYSEDQRIDVPVDLISELWIEQGVCAVAWSLGLVRGTQVFLPLDFQGNLDRDPLLAAQNRFPLQLYPYADGDYILVAVLDLGTTVVRASWPIHVPSVDVPTAFLLTDDDQVPAVMGCEVFILFANHVGDDLNPCADDVDDPPTETAVVKAGSLIRFWMTGAGDPWQVDDASAICGRLEGPSFVPGEECLARVFPIQEGGAAFRVPRREGQWVVSISGCGWTEASRPVYRNQVCGSWYVNIAVRA